jgi:diguanylate cyclase (GGDEF)-like protein
VVLIPTAGMAVLAGPGTATRWFDRRTSSEVEADADALRALMATRAAVTQESVYSQSIAAAAALGLDPGALATSLGFNLVDRARAARASVDADPTLATYPELAAYLPRLALLRPQIDAGTATTAVVNALFTPFISAIDAIWQNRIGNLRGDVDASSSGGGLVADRLAAVDTGFTAFTTLITEVGFASSLESGTRVPATVGTLIDGNGRLAIESSSLAGRLGPRAAAAWQALQRDPATSRFQAVIDRTIQASLTGAPSPFASTGITAYAVAFTDSLAWIADLSDVVQAATADLRDAAGHEHDIESRALLIDGSTAILVVVLSLLAALLFARAVDTPLRRLASAARQISRGNFALPPISPRGPRELADTAEAVNEMTATLIALETYAVTLERNPASPSLDDLLPGRTGAALQATLDQLRQSIRAAAESRVVLQQRATHDSLTGLLNRGAALDAITRALSQAQREGTTMMALFVDLDGLKAINDTYSHDAGDDAIRLTADALRATTRQSDVVARIGGDEFLIAGSVDDGRVEVQALADRVRRAVAARAVTVDGERISLHCSIGAAIAEPGDTVESLIHNSDQALLDAKQRGRDRVSWHPVGARSASL